ncbi:MAG: c-type cytochrome [Acidobacteria bacterium]|nr:c-type cytochrome [Acidobacteriota bacterium]MDA1234293.1 c-type cytochrome [Acidobacteriota bacterium]
MARKFLTWFALLMTISVSVMFYLILKDPQMRELKNLRVDSTPERIARGEYLANNLLSCVHCHTQRDRDDYSLPAVGPAFAGGDCLDETWGFPGKMCTPNITSDAETGIGAWTDDEVLRAIREGISRDGIALFPLMPFDAYRDLPDEDAYAVIAYLRTIPPVSRSTPATVVNFPMSVIVRQIPTPLEEPVPPVSRDDEATYGAHLAKIASCIGCHSEDVDDLAGGQSFPLPSGPLASPNITPDPTGVLPEEYDGFVRMFRKFAPENEATTAVDPEHLTVMPWRTLGGLTDEDLHALFTYLRTVRPVENAVQVYPADPEVK